MSHRPTPVSLATIKDLLNAYADECTGVPRERVEREFGDLLLTLVRLAGRLDLDLIEAGQRQIARTAQVAPKLVAGRAALPDDKEN
ncbi:MAG TPA: hypothetical protein VMT49_00630 [Steroidobacteraceae bacterium]|nr:hypothetical protein [Steroidobacteraceae bacterium]